MKMLSINEINQVSGGMISFLTMSANVLSFKVTDDSRFYSAGSINGHQISAILYANDICDLNENSFGYDFSQPFTHNGAVVTTQKTEGGHIYTFTYA